MSVASTGSQRWQETVRFGDLLLRAAERDPEHEALVFPGARLTYRELEQRAFAVARSLLALGIGPQSRVGILMPNCLEFVELLFGISLVGGVMVPINARFAPRELAYVIENGDLEVMFTSDVVIEHVDYVERLHEALPDLGEHPANVELDLLQAPRLRRVVLLGAREVAGMATGNWFAGLVERASEEDILVRHRRTSVRSAALMMYTSGTTAMPKGCVLSHEALVRTAVVAGRTKFRITSADRFWDPLPMFHMSAILPIIGVFDGGGTFLSMTHFEAGSALQMLDDERTTISFATFPAITQALLNHPDYHPDRWRGIRIINNVAPPDTLRDMQSRMPHTVQISSYGLTECGGVVAFNDPEDTLEQRCTSSGIPFDGIEVEVRDLVSGEPAPPAVPGEIVVRGYCVFDRYHKDPERTAEAVDDDGWFHTGDIGALTADGRISYLGRTKDMLKVGGENVAAIEIESFIATHPGVSIVAVVGVPDAKYMEVPAAFIELRPGHRVTEDEIVEFCRRGLARFKVPRHVRFIDRWPMSATKIQKFRLQEQLTRELAEAVRSRHEGAPA
ncbi:MAG TPA: class I adenylate-forming enzyme family protein [Solirubrobacteraceae bacterium]|nr:class I adenylate-forming enzyme family protein [Solirubrobacteraceae bacterium]HTX10479.1 class I adenylate-forming enzyme family protein [Solirubrobacteraceae bacterium]